MKIQWSRWCAGLIVLIVLLMQVATTALANNTASPSLDSTPSVKTIMNRVDHVAKRMPVAHGVGASVLSGSTRTKSGVKSYTEKGQFSGNATMDGSQQSAIREKLELHAGSQTKVRTIEYFTRKGLLAERAAGSTKWLCGSVQELETIAAWTPDSYQFRLPGSPSRSWVAGTTRFQGFEVWKVNYRLKSGNRSAFDHESGTFLVDKRLSVIRHVSAVSDTGRGGSRSHETSSVTLSGFGKVKLAAFPKC